VQVIKSSFSANGVAVSDSFCHELYSHYSTADAYILYDDVIPCLQRLSRAGVVMGVISDFDERLEGIQQGLGVSSYIAFIVQSFVEGYSKPSKELWTTAISQAGGQVEEGWHVGDDPKKDAFEDPTIIIVDRSGAITTDFQKITSLEQLPRLLNIP
jgi:FMN phosphatase YigB (HAD superfamily)